jgi:6-phosphofructokinase 1
MSLQYDNGSVAMKRTGNGDNYGVEYFRTDLSNVAEHTKSVPDEFINADGNGMTDAFIEYAGMTDAFIEYAKPLVGKLPQTEYLGNLPKV